MPAILSLAAESWLYSMLDKSPAEFFMALTNSSEQHYVKSWDGASSPPTQCHAPSLLESYLLILAPPVEHWIYGKCLGTILHGRRHLWNAIAMGCSKYTKHLGGKTAKRTDSGAFHTFATVSQCMNGAKPYCLSFFLYIYIFPLGLSKSIGFSQEGHMKTQDRVWLFYRIDRQLPPVPIASFGNLHISS